MQRGFLQLTLQQGGQSVYVNRELITHLTGGLSATTVHMIGGSNFAVTQDIDTVLQLVGAPDIINKAGTIAQAA